MVQLSDECMKEGRRETRGGTAALPGAQVQEGVVEPTTGSTGVSTHLCTLGSLGTRPGQEAPSLQSSASTQCPGLIYTPRVLTRTSHPVHWWPATPVPPVADISQHYTIKCRFGGGALLPHQLQTTPPPPSEAGAGFPPCCDTLKTSSAMITLQSWPPFPPWAAALRSQRVQRRKSRQATVGWTLVQS